MKKFIVLGAGPCGLATAFGLAKNNISVDVRSQGIRISPHIYNDEANMSHLIEVIKPTKF